MPEHGFRARRVVAGQQLRVRERVVEEVRFHLRVQQVQRLGEFLLGGGLRGAGALAAAQFADAAVIARTMASAFS